VTNDVLHGTRCPECGIATCHPESSISRIAADEVLSQTPDGVFYRLLRLWFQCATCSRVFQIVVKGDLLTTGQTVAWLHAHPYQLLPEDAPR
jgi:DNA-directed RNA polymerase subunit RPC12/RpoP